MDDFLSKFDRLPDMIWDLLLIAVAIAIGLLVKTLLSLFFRRKPSGQPHYSITRSILVRMGKPFSYLLPLLTLNFLLPLMKIKAALYPALDRTVGILLTLAFAYVLIGVVKIFEDYAYHSFDITKADNLKERKIRTQLQFIRKLAIGLIVMLPESYDAGVIEHTIRDPYVTRLGLRPMQHILVDFRQVAGPPKQWAIISVS